MDYKDIESLIYNGLEYAVGAIVKFKDTDGHVHLVKKIGEMPIRKLRSIIERTVDNNG